MSRKFQLIYTPHNASPTSSIVMLDPNACPTKQGKGWPHPEIIVKFAMGNAHLGRNMLWEPGGRIDITEWGDNGVWEAKGATWTCRVTDMEF